MSKANVKANDEWATISGAFCATQGAATAAFAALADFDSRAPSQGGQSSYNAWRDANEAEREALEHATIVAALNYFKAHAAERQYFELLDELDARAARYEASVTRPRVSKKDVLKGPKKSVLVDPPPIKKDVHKLSVLSRTIN